MRCNICGGNHNTWACGQHGLLILFTLFMFGCAMETTKLTGPKGEVGLNGEAGVNGSNGGNGLDGSNGVGCNISIVLANIAAPNGGALVSCSTGSVLVLNGTNGLNGNDGIDGVDGSAGSNGSNGTNGTNGLNSLPIIFIKLCNAPVTFPTSLPEYGICDTQDNMLYGVYWMSDMAWLGAIPNGSYNSTSSTTSCSFSVSGCTVTH